MPNGKKHNLYIFIITATDYWGPCLDEVLRVSSLFLTIILQNSYYPHFVVRKLRPPGFLLGQSETAWKRQSMESKSCSLTFNSLLLPPLKEIIIYKSVLQNMLHHMVLELWWKQERKTMQWCLFIGFIHSLWRHRQRATLTEGWPCLLGPGSAAHMLPGSCLQSEENTVTPENKTVFINGRDVYAMAWLLCLRSFQNWIFQLFT